MNFKKIIAIVLTATAVFASFGCGGGKQNSSGESAGISTQQKKTLDEAAIKTILKKMESSNIADKKEICPFEKLPGYSFDTTPLRDSRITLDANLKFDNLVISNIKQDGDFASVKLSYLGADKQQHHQKLWYFRRLEGKWVYDCFGIKSSKSLKVSGYDESKLEAAANIGYTFDNELVIVLDVRSKTTASFEVGGFGRTSYSLITDKGEYPVQNTEWYSLDSSSHGTVTSAKPLRIYIPFKGAVGAPKALRITSFNEIGSNSLPVGYDVNQVVTFTFSE